MEQHHHHLLRQDGVVCVEGEMSGWSDVLLFLIATRMTFNELESVPSLHV